VHRLSRRSLYSLVELGYDWALPSLSILGFSQPLLDMGSQAFLNFLGFLVEDLCLMVHSVELLADNLAPDFNCDLTLNTSCTICSTSVGSELKERCRASLHFVRCVSNAPRILSKCSIQSVIMGLERGAGLFVPLVLLLRYFTRKLIEKPGDRGARTPDCDLAKGVLPVSILGALSCDNSSLPSSCCHSMTSHALPLQAIFSTSYLGTLSLVSSPHWQYLKVWA